MRWVTDSDCQPAAGSQLLGMVELYGDAAKVEALAPSGLDDRRQQQSIGRYRGVIADDGSVARDGSLEVSGLVVAGGVTNDARVPLAIRTSKREPFGRLRFLAARSGDLRDSPHHCEAVVAVRRSIEQQFYRWAASSGGDGGVDDAEPRQRCTVFGRPRSGRPTSALPFARWAMLSTGVSTRNVTSSPARSTRRSIVAPEARFATPM